MTSEMKPEGWKERARRLLRDAHHKERAALKARIKELKELEERVGELEALGSLATSEEYLREVLGR